MHARGDRVESVLLMLGDGVPANQAEYFISLFEQMLGEVRTVLTGNAGDERSFGQGCGDCLGGVGPGKLSVGLDACPQAQRPSSRASVFLRPSSSVWKRW